jgi:hypothetical protein
MVVVLQLAATRSQSNSRYNICRAGLTSKVDLKVNIEDIVGYALSEIILQRYLVLQTRNSKWL